jgi:hypothetical protein
MDSVVPQKTFAVSDAKKDMEVVALHQNRPAQATVPLEERLVTTRVGLPLEDVTKETQKTSTSQASPI